MKSVISAACRLPKCTPVFCSGRRSFAKVARSLPNVHELSKMAQISVSDKEALDWQPKISGIVDWFGQLQQVDVSGLSPAIHASEQPTALRKDEAKLFECRAELLAMSPALERGYVRVPKSIGEEIATAAQQAEAAPPAVAESPSLAPAAAELGTAVPPTAAELESLHALDIRVGKIVSCERHPEADSLYVEKIDVGEPEPRTIVSGLVKYVPLEKMQDRMVIVICNLKPRNMRGIKSFGMVLAASNEEHTVVEPLEPPAGAKPGERVSADGTKQAAPATANVVEKKKHWEAVQPLLRTGPDGTAMWKGQLLGVPAGSLKSGGLIGARIT